MKKLYVLMTVVVIGLIGSGCSSTWDGVKKDSGEAWDSTKKTIHKATE